MPPRRNSSSNSYSVGIFILLVKVPRGIFRLRLSKPEFMVTILARVFLSSSACPILRRQWPPSTASADQLRAPLKSRDSADFAFVVIHRGSALAYINNKPPKVGKGRVISD